MKDIMNKNTLRTYPIELHESVVFRDEWSEKDLFGYSIYKVTNLNKSRSQCTVQEIVSGHTYENIKLTELRPLNLN